MVELAEITTLDQSYEDEIRLLVNVGIEIGRRSTSSTFEFYKPNQKHMEFFRLGAEYPERCFTACNRGGKSTAGAFEDVCHLTGLYPIWWNGYRFRGAVIGAVIGNTARQMRAAIQQILLGTPGNWGSGMIPRELLGEIKTVHGVSGAVDYFQVKHIDGRSSTCYLVTSEQGWRAVQGFNLHFIHCDEEPAKNEAIDLYSELVPRLVINRGIMYITATPQQGMTDLMSFYFMDDEEPGDASDVAVLRREGAAYRTLIRMTLDDVDHMDDEQKRRFKALCPPSQRRFRLEGYPGVGERRVWEFSWDAISVDPFDVKREGWKFIRGMDSGFSNSYTALVDLAIDPDGVIYIFNCNKIRKTLVADVSPILVGMDDLAGIKAPTAWPRDINKTDQCSGMVPVEEYRKHGVNMLTDPVQFDDERQHYVNPGLQLIEELFHTGKLKVFRHPRMNPWKKEWEYFSYDEDGFVMKTKNRQNDLMDATRYGVVGWYRGWAKRRIERNREPMKGFALARPGDSWN